MSISCKFFLVEKPVAKVLFVTGYNESSLKYSELIYDLAKYNVSIYCYDHRGQGFSEKFSNQNKRGYLDSFGALVDDLCMVFDKVKEDENKNIPIYIIAHSMGGAAVTCALSEKRINPQEVILAAPLFGLFLGSYAFLELPLYWLSLFYCLFGKAKSYVFGCVDCIPHLPFDTNDVTHSKYRFFTWRKHLAENVELQCGGPTFGWLAQIIRATRKLRRCGKEIKVPLTILQAQEDTVVSNIQQDLFVENCPQAKKIVMEHARHEIFMELDFIRNKALELVKKIIKVV